MSCPDGFWCVQFKDVINTLILSATVFAIYYGPLRAVEISRENEEINRQAAREKEILVNLMKTRRATLDPLHVMSLNLVELEFHSSPEIISCYRKYIDNLTNMKLGDNPSQDEVEKFTNVRAETFVDLVHAIAQKLGYQFDKRDLQKFSYTPQGWQNLEQEQQAFRRLVLELLNGSRALPVREYRPSDTNGKYPPAPS